MRCLGGDPEVSQLAITAKPYRTAIQRSAVTVRHPSLSNYPTRLFTNATKHDFQRGREMVGRGHLYRDGLQQAELFLRSEERRVGKECRSGWAGVPGIE